MEIFSGIVDFDHSAVDAFAIAFIASGILACFFGYRLLRIVLGVTGFIAVGSLVWTLLTGTGYEQDVVVFGAVLGALLGAVAMFYVGVFLFGCALGLLVSVLVLGFTGSGLNVLVACIFTLAGGLVTLLSRKVLIVTSTALTGAWIALAGVSYFVEDFDLVSILSEPNLLRSQGGWYYLMLALWALLAMGGIGVQIRALRKSR